MQKPSINVMWFRRDLRLHDNTALFAALGSNYPILPLFIFDPEILDQLENKKDRRVDFIHQVVTSMDDQLSELETGLLMYYKNPQDVFKELTERYTIEGIYTNEDYEPNAIARDRSIKTWAESNQIAFNSFKDQVIFAKNEIIKNDLSPYTVYTPYAKKWKDKLSFIDYQSHQYTLQSTQFIPRLENHSLKLEQLGFNKTNIKFEQPIIDPTQISSYTETRDYPALDNTSRLGMALRFGTLSVREAVRQARSIDETWLSELIWREFFMQILYHFPAVTNRNFKVKYDAIQWRNNLEEFKSWCEGKTGYPIVDAGMKQLNESGFMHNRVRMIAASFLCKHLLIEWQWGEAYFALKLDDYDLAANNGNWQWAAGTGCDAAPYFRIFNPMTQTQRFDKDQSYINRWLTPEHILHIAPIVDHNEARERCLETYKTGLKDFET